MCHSWTGFFVHCRIPEEGEIRWDMHKALFIRTRLTGMIYYHAEIGLPPGDRYFILLNQFHNINIAREEGHVKYDLFGA
jgi:hypothetical protein